MLEVSDAWGIVEVANGCNVHATALDFAKDDVLHVLSAHSGCEHGEKDCGSYCNRWGWAVFVLRSGRYVYAWEDSDTSGHG